jgi:hypothetical protein
MIWIVTLGLQLGFIVAGIRREQCCGLWSWPLFLFALGFAAVEVALAVVPAWALDLHSRRYWWIVGAGWLIAVLNFAWFIVICRRWTLAAEPAGDGQSR